MKTLTVNKLNLNDTTVDNLSSFMDKERVEYQPISCVNWQEYPYVPNAKFRIAYTDNAFLLNYKVEEKSVRAKYGKDNEAVWTDSCVEFFVIPGDDDIYYNIESNCIGTVLVGAGAGRTGREPASKSVMSQIQRWSSLGKKTFEERVENTQWELSLIIPFTIFFKNDIQSLGGKIIRANFYKCGDELQTPHFVSWNRIEVPAPNFHVPEFFGELKLK